MGRVVAIAPVSKTKEMNKYIANNTKKQETLERALNKAKTSIGVDLFEVITGNEKETHKLNMKRHQDRMHLR